MYVCMYECFSYSMYPGGRYRSSSQQQPYDMVPAPLSARFAEGLGAIKRPSVSDLARTKVKGWASDKRKLQLVCAYVPGLVVDEFISGGGEVSLPKSIAFDAAVLFADISGFSRLAERLVHTFKDAANAAEMLTNYIGRSLDRMVNTICAKGGDVVKFAGDAILAVFPAKIFATSRGEL
jgi:class 3 adenylate cyclase